LACRGRVAWCLDAQLPQAVAEGLPDGVELRIGAEAGFGPAVELRGDRGGAQRISRVEAPELRPALGDRGAPGAGAGLDGGQLGAEGVQVGVPDTERILEAMAELVRGRVDVGDVLQPDVAALPVGLAEDAGLEDTALERQAALAHVTRGLRE